MNDRDKAYLLKELTRTIDESDSTAAFCLCQRWILKDALALLKAQEPRTETQGRWECVGSDGIVCCSVCGMPMNKTRVCFPNGESGYYYIATKYCPHCGAKNEKGDCDG